MISSCLIDLFKLALPADFRISSVTLSIKPGPEVRRNANVTLRCQAKVIASEQEALSREYVIYKDEQVVYKKATDSPEDFLYLLPEARVSNNGKYKCRIKIREQEMTSEVQKLTVTGGPALRQPCVGACGSSEVLPHVSVLPSGFQAWRCPFSTSTEVPSPRGTTSRPPAQRRARRVPFISTFSTTPESSARSA